MTQHRGGTVVSIKAPLYRERDRQGKIAAELGVPFAGTSPVKDTQFTFGTEVVKRLVEIITGLRARSLDSMMRMTA